MADQTIPIGGGWVMITRELPTEIKPPLLSMYYAMPARLFSKGWHTQRYGAFGCANPSETEMTLLWRSRNGGRLLSHERQAIDGLDDFELDQRVHIVTADGDVWVEPYEWTPVSDIDVYFDMIDGNDIKLHLLGGAPIRGVLADQIFYMRTRGLSKVECYQALFGKIRKPSICWLEIHQKYAEYFLGRRTRRRTNPEPMRVEIVDTRTTAPAPTP